MALRLMPHQTPDKTYISFKNAVAALTKTCARYGIADLEYTILSEGADDRDGRVRYFPMALIRADQIQIGIILARAGIPAFRN